jgi:hypothetical protein
MRAVRALYRRQIGTPGPAAVKQAFRADKRTFRTGESPISPLAD